MHPNSLTSVPSQRDCSTNSSPCSKVYNITPPTSHTHTHTHTHHTHTEHAVQTDTQEAFLSSDNLLTVYNSPKMKTLISKTSLLASVDLRTLTTPTEQTSFYANVVNFLSAHCLMVCVAEDNGEGGVGFLSRSGIALGDMESSPLLRAGVFSRVGYRVGQLGLVSCHDLLYCILRRGLSHPLAGREAPLHCRIGESASISLRRKTVSCV